MWIRGLVFTALVPLVIVGWLLVAAGAATYCACLTRFIASGGTPAIFFTRPARAILGDEPRHLVQGRLYAVSRNPMYVGVVVAVFGQAIVFTSQSIAAYGLFLWLIFHVVVVGLEEPHLRGLYGAAYDDYCRRVPRWLGVPRSMVS